MFAVILRCEHLRASKDGKTGASSPSFETRRKKERAPQDDGGGFCTVKPRLAKHILKHTFANCGNTVEFDRRAHHGQIKMPGGVAPGEFVGAGGKQEISGNRAQ